MVKMIQEMSKLHIINLTHFRDFNYDNNGFDHDYNDQDFEALDDLNELNMSEN